MSPRPVVRLHAICDVAYLEMTGRPAASASDTRDSQDLQEALAALPKKQHAAYLVDACRDLNSNLQICDTMELSLGRIPR